MNILAIEGPKSWEKMTTEDAYQLLKNYFRKLIENSS